MKEKTQDRTLTRSRFNIRFRLFKKISIVSFVILAIMILALPGIVSTAPGKAFIISQLEQATGAKITMQSLSFGWLKGISISRLDYNDQVRNISLNIEHIKSKPALLSLIFGRAVINDTVIDKAKLNVELIESEINSPNEKSQKTLIQKAGIVPQTKFELPIHQLDLKINNSQALVTINDENNHQRQLRLSSINSQIAIKPAGKTSTIQFSSVVPQDNEASLTMNAQIKKAGNNWNFKKSDGDIDLQIKNLDLEQVSVLAELMNMPIQMQGQIDAQIKGELKDGLLDNIQAQVKGESITIRSELLDGDTFFANMLNIDIDLKEQEDIINIANLSAASEWFNISAAGSLPKSLESVKSFLDKDSKLVFDSSLELDLAKAFNMFKHTINIDQNVMVNRGLLDVSIKTIDVPTKTLAITAGINNLAGKAGVREIAIQTPVNLRTNLRLQDDDIYFDKLSLQSNFCDAACNGKLSDFDYKYTLDISAFQNEIGDFFDLHGYRYAGTVSENGRIQKNDSIYSVVGTAAMNNFSVAKNEFSASENKMNFDFDISFDSEQQSVTINKCNCISDNIILTISDSEIPTSKESDASLKAKVTCNALLENVWPFLQVYDIASKDLGIAGRFDGQISINQKNSIYVVKCDKAGIVNLKISKADQKPFEQKNIDAYFNAQIDPAQNTFSVDRLELKSDNIELRFNELSQSASKQKRIFKADAQFQYDWADVSLLLGNFVPAGIDIRGKRTDNIKVFSAYDPSVKNSFMSNMQSQLNIGFNSAEYLGMEFGQTNLQLNIANAKLTLQPFTTAVNEGKVSFAGTADMNIEPLIFKTPGPINAIDKVRLSKKVAQKLLSNINPIFSGVMQADGILNLSLEKCAYPLGKADKNIADIEGTFSIDNLKLTSTGFFSDIITATGHSPQQATINITPTKFRLENGILSYDKMEMLIGDNPVIFAGQVGMDKFLNMTVKLPYSYAGKTIRKGTEAADMITLPITGTIDKPVLNLGQLLQIEAQKLIETQLQKLFK